MASPGEVQMIVERLREYKIEEDLTLVTFDEKSAPELLETLNNVFKQLSKDHDVDVRDEEIQATANRMMEFFPVIQYNFQGEPEQFAEGIQRGERAVVYPLLVHILQRLPDLKKRAYLARFLRMIDVPEELFADPEVMDKFQQYKDLQESFKETHKSTERLRGTSLQPTELKREVAQLEGEKQQLKTKIHQLETKLKKNENFTELYEVTSKLRKEQEEEARLAERLQEQIMQLKQSELRFFQSKKKLQDVQAASHQGTGEELLRRLEEDVQMTRILCLEKLPSDIQQKQNRLKQIQAILELPSIEELQIKDLQGGIKQEEDRISDLGGQLARRQQPGDDKLSMYRQQALIVSRKKQDALERLQMRKDELREVEQELNERREKSGGTGVRILKGAEFAEYAGKLKEKAREYKRLKGELSSITAEKGVLVRTEEVLRSRVGDQAALLAGLEASRGVKGAGELQGRLEEVSAAAAATNQQKAASLEQISATVARINETIKEKKNKLAPLIKELRNVRAEFSTLEAEHAEKKALYEQAALGLDAERDKLATEVAAYQEECRREESRFHYLHAMSASTRVVLERARREDAGRNRIGDAAQSYRELYQSRIQQQENLSKTLRERQKAVKEGYEAGLGQARMFRDLRSILQCKLRVLRADADPDAAGAGGGGAGGGGFGGAAANVMIMD